MLGVRLREHHQLGIGGIAPERAERARPGSRSPRPTAPDPSRRLARSSAARPRRRARRVRSGRGCGRAANRLRGIERVEPQRFGHAVVQRGAEPASAPRLERGRARARKYSVPRSMRRTTSRARRRARCRWPCSTRARPCRCAASPSSRPAAHPPAASGGAAVRSRADGRSSAEFGAARAARRHRRNARSGRRARATRGVERAQLVVQLARAGTATAPARPAG